MGASDMTTVSSNVSTLLIDGEPVCVGNGAFPTIDPASEEPLGHAADGHTDDMDRAIAAACIAFDDSDLSSDVALRVYCLRQLRDALTEELEHCTR